MLGICFLAPWPLLVAYQARVAARPAVRKAMREEGLIGTCGFGREARAGDVVAERDGATTSLRPRPEPSGGSPMG